MTEETKVSNETVVDSDTENVTQEPAQNEYIAESKKLNLGYLNYKSS